MTEEEMIDALSDKMHVEQDRFKEELLKRPPEEILRDAYSYWMREDIILAVEGRYLTEDHLSALLNLDSDHDALGPMVDCLEELADRERQSAEREQKRPSIREQLKAGGHSTQERTGKPPVPER